jgi:protein TonB
MVPPTAALAPPEPLPPEATPVPAEPLLLEEPLPEAAVAQSPSPAEEAPVEKPREQIAEAPPQEPLEPVEPAEAAADPPAVTAPPLKPTKEVALPEPVKQATPARQKSAAKQQIAEAEPSEPGQADTELAALPSPGSNAAASTQGSSSAPGSSGAPQVGVSPGELQDYGQLLAAWLDRHKRYPDQARKRRQEGVVTVELAIDGQGHMVSHRIVDDSGVAALDQEAYALLERASPFPLPPGGGTHSFQVPIVFSLR